MRLTRRASFRICLSATLVTFALGGCGGSGSTTPKVGDCIDAHQHLVDCGSASATEKLVSDLRAPNAIACVAIGDKPQTQVTVAGHPFCAETK